MVWEKKSSRLGEVNFNKFGSRIVIIEYKNTTSIKVQFDNGYVVHTTYDHFIKGEVKSPYEKRFWGVGYLGEGIKTAIKGKNIPEYNLWSGMISRCYKESYHRKRPTYKDCSVCEEWHNFQNFARWYGENYYEIEGETVSLDKDILIKGNKIYSPETCVFAPQKINTLFIKSNSVRGKYPIGVSWHKKDKLFYSRCNDGFENNIDLGHFTTPEEAYVTYKRFKEQIIKNFADAYKDKIPQKLYNAMYRYKVEITD